MSEQTITREQTIMRPLTEREADALHLDLVEEEESGHAHWCRFPWEHPTSACLAIRSF